MWMTQELGADLLSRTAARRGVRSLRPRCLALVARAPRAAAAPPGSPPYPATGARVASCPGAPNSSSPPSRPPALRAAPPRDSPHPRARPPAGRAALAMRPSADSAAVGGLATRRPRSRLALRRMCCPDAPLLAGPARRWRAALGPGSPLPRPALGPARPPLEWSRRRVKVSRRRVAAGACAVLPPALLSARASLLPPSAGSDVPSAPGSPRPGRSAGSALGARRWVAGLARWAPAPRPAAFVFDGGGTGLAVSRGERRCRVDVGAYLGHRLPRAAWLWDERRPYASSSPVGAPRDPLVARASMFLDRPRARLRAGRLPTRGGVPYPGHRVALARDGGIDPGIAAGRRAPSRGCCPSSR